MFNLVSRDLFQFARKSTIFILFVSLFPACKTATTQVPSDSEIKGTQTVGLGENQVNKFADIFLAHTKVAISNGGTVPALLAKALQTGILKARNVAGGYPTADKLREIFITSLIKSDALFGNNQRAARFPNPKDPTDRKLDIRISEDIHSVFVNVMNATNKDLRLNPTPELKELAEVLKAADWTNLKSPAVY